MLLSLYISSLIYTAWSESLSYAVVYTALLLCGQAYRYLLRDEVVNERYLVEEVYDREHAGRKR